MKLSTVSKPFRRKTYIQVSFNTFFMRKFFLRICTPAFFLKICLSLLVYFFCCVFQLNAQQHSFLDKVIEITQMSSVYRHNVDPVL